MMAVITWQEVFISAMQEGLGVGFAGNHPLASMVTFAAARPMNQAKQRFVAALPIWNCTAPK